ncbi:MAG: XdhC family protein [Rhabdaerophilum sp.]
MKLALLSALNAKIAAREPVAIVTEIASGEARLVVPEKVSTDPLAEALHEAFRSGKSGVVSEGAAFINVHLPPVKLIVTGAVHISQALAEIARVAALDCTIVDPRTAFATEERFKGIRVLAEWPDEALPKLGLDRFTAFVALTHDPKIDDPGLNAALRSGCFYIGALGSRKTHARRVERLAEAGFSAEDIARIQAPIGLDIGAVSPAEIAISIAGEIIAAMREKRRAG